MTNWTEAQASAISDRGGALLVSAAAGSGKTAVLVERAFCLMTDKAQEGSLRSGFVVSGGA